MKPVSSPESLISDHSVMTRSPIGAQSLLLRFLIVGLVVGVYIALGFLFHLTVAEYQLLGIPILLIFQLGIHRQPLRTLWVRSGPPLQLDAWFFLLPGHERLEVERILERHEDYFVVEKTVPIPAA